MNVYEQNGYKNRKHYLMSLAEEYELSYQLVVTTAQLLGPSEDFDGLITMLEDAQDMEFEY